MDSHILPVRDYVQATPRNRIITIDLADTRFSFTAGQAVFAGLADGTVRRPYSIACSPTQAREKNAIELLVQIDDHTPPDPHLERAVRGTSVRIDGPFGSFGLPSPLPERHLLFIAGGTGIAPLRSMLWETLANETEEQIALIYSARGPEELAFREELSTLATARRIDLRLTITRDADRTWTGGRGRIDEVMIRELLQTPETRCVVCGPPALVSEAAAALKRAGVADARIVMETYEG